MNKTILAFLIACLSSNALANYASKEYVDKQVNTAVTNLSKEIDAIRVNPHVIGETYQGGIIFFVDDTGLHGLIAAKQDANEGQAVQWKNGETGEKITNAHANGLFAGAINTKLIIGQQTMDVQEGNFAALSAANYSAQADGNSPCSSDSICYGDWSLPSIYELNLMQKNLSPLGILNATSYWSSTEGSVNEAWIVDMQTGSKSLCDKASLALVRAVRAF